MTYRPHGSPPVEIKLRLSLSLVQGVNFTSHVIASRHLAILHTCISHLASRTASKSPPHKDDSVMNQENFCPNTRFASVSSFGNRRRRPPSIPKCCLADVLSLSFYRIPCTAPFESAALYSRWWRSYLSNTARMSLIRPGGMLDYKPFYS